MTRSLTQGAAGSRQIICPCFVVALRGHRHGVRPGQGPGSGQGPGPRPGTYMTSGTAQWGPSAVNSRRARRRGGITSDTVRTQRQRSSPASGAPGGREEPSEPRLRGSPESLGARRPPAHPAEARPRTDG